MGREKKWDSRNYYKNYIFT